MNKRAVLALLAITIVGSTAALAEQLPPIEKVEIGPNRQFLVNGKPFFPIMSWLQNKRNYPMLRKVGINTYTGDADAAAARDSGGYIVTAFKADLAKDDRVLGWIHGDEPDMPGKTKEPRSTPEKVIATYQDIKAADAAHPVFVTFTGAFYALDTKYPADVRAKIYPEYVKGADVVGFDIYPIYGSGFASHLNYVGNGVAELRTIAGPKRPIYAWIETSKGSKWMTYEKQPDVLPMHTRHEVWQAIINGATAIGYFTHAWRPTSKDFAPTADMQKEMTRLDAQITQLAAAILADPATAKITMKLGDDLTCQLKATQLAGATYIFALNKDLGPDGDKGKQFDPIAPRQGKATFTVPGLKAGATIEVIDENRTLTAQNGTFTDDFAALAEHIYKLKP